MCRSYRRLATLLFALTLPLILLLIGAWEFVLEPVFHGPEDPGSRLEYFYTAAFFSTVALGIASVIVFYLGAGMDRERAIRERATDALERAQRIGQVGSWEWRRDSKEITLSAVAASITGLGDAAMKVNEKRCFELLPRDDLPLFRKGFERLSAVHGHLDRIHRIVRPDGEIRHLHSRAETLTDPDDPTRIVGVAGTVHDITERVETEERLRLHAAVFTHSSEAIIVTNPDGIIADVNPAFLALTGYRSEEVVGEAPNILKSGEHPRSFYAAMWGDLLSHGDWRGEVKNRVKDGSIVPMELYISAVPDEQGKPNRFVAILNDLTVRKEYEDNLKRLAATDGLTGVANRRAFDKALEREWRRAMRNVTPITLLMIDIDLFKDFNDNYGHQEGDRCLKTVACALSLMVNRPGDLVSRYGGEEFAVILPQTSLGEGLLIAESMREAIIATHDKNAHLNMASPVTISIGVASAIPQRHGSFDPLISQADAALYRAKQEGRNQVVLADMVDHRRR